MHKDTAVKLQNISKLYKLYDKPVDRLKESLHPFKKKYHKEFHALKDINLEIKKGEVLGIVGVNGAGKSTLLKIIAGVVTPTSGRITIKGRLNAILELSSGLKPEMTGRENIKLNLQINQIVKDTEKITQEIIDFADIGLHIDQPVKTYSSGMKARLGFGLATSTDPDVLIVDEVLAVGDVLFQRKCYAKIEKLFKDGKTVIFVSHNAQSVIEFCSRAILLYDKEVILEDTPKKVTDFYQKLVFSKKHNEVLDEIKGNVVAKNEQTQIIKELEVDKEFYLPEFKSKPIIYRNYDVDIFDIMILNTNGEKVNILETEKYYTYQYKIKFNDSFENVNLGTQLKTTKGLLLSAISLHLKEDKLLKIVEKDTVYTIDFEFKCSLLEGDYFFNAGVSIFNDGNLVFLNRIIDALIFKVKGSDSIVRGLINQDYKILVERQ